jgi:hypothetical protein
MIAPAKRVISGLTHPRAGVSLLAIAVYQATSMSNVKWLSRAGSLLQGIGGFLEDERILGGERARHTVIQFNRR